MIGLLKLRQRNKEHQGPYIPHPHPQFSHHPTPGQSKGSRNGLFESNGQNGNEKWNDGRELVLNENGIGTKLERGPAPDHGPVTAAAKSEQNLKKRRVRRKVTEEGRVFMSLPGWRDRTQVGWVEGF